MATAPQAGAECGKETGRFVGPEPVACGGFACKDQGGRKDCQGVPSLNSGDLSKFNRLRRRLAIAVITLVVVTAVGVVGFALIGGAEHGLLDALCMTVITLTTVGFGEIIDMSNSPGGRMFTLLLLLVGFAIVSYAVPMMTAFVIEGQLLNVFARRRMNKTIRSMSDHYVVTGGTAVASHVVEELVNTGRSVVLVAPEGASTGEPDTGTVPVVVGDPTDDSALKAAGIDRAAGFIACTESEKDNILAVLTARRLAPRVRIVAATERVATEGKLLTLESGMTLVVMTDVEGRSRLEKLLKGACFSRT